MFPENFAGVRFDLAERDGAETASALKTEAVGADAAEQVQNLERLAMRDGARDMRCLDHAALRVCTDPAKGAAGSRGGQTRRLLAQ